MPEHIEDVAQRVLAARDGDEDARDTVIEDAIALAEHVLSDSSSYARGRKRHQVVATEEYARLFDDGLVRYVTVSMAATALNVSEATARRRLDGLLVRGEVERYDTHNAGNYNERVRYVRKRACGHTSLEPGCGTCAVHVYDATVAP